MGNVREKENSSQDNEQRQALPMKMLLAAGIFIVVVIIPAMAIVILGLKQPSTPREAILRHPDGEMVVAGITKKDLEQAMKASKEWARRHVSNVRFARHWPCHQTCQRNEVLNNRITSLNVQSADNRRAAEGPNLLGL
jgi:hypothetical protein